MRLAVADRLQVARIDESPKVVAVVASVQTQFQSRTLELRRAAYNTDDFLSGVSADAPADRRQLRCTRTSSFAGRTPPPSFRS